jgi:hypothetical protein
MWKGLAHTQHLVSQAGSRATRAPDAGFFVRGQEQARSEAGGEFESRAVGGWKRSRKAGRESVWVKMERLDAWE